MVTDAGYACSRSQINLTCNYGILPKKDPKKFKAAINRTLKSAGLSSVKAWQPMKTEAGGARPSKSNAAGCLPSKKITQRRETSMMNRTKTYLELEELKHFALTGDPFHDILDPSQIWMSARMRQVKHLIGLTVENYGLMVLTGDFGAGKSTLLRHVLGERLRDGRTQIIMPDRLDRKALKGDMLTIAVIAQLGAGMSPPRSVVARDALAKKLLVQACSRGEHPFLVIDEAHELTSDLVVALKRLWDSGLIFRNVGILLVGSGGKDDKGRPWGLRWKIEGDPDLREFAERTRLVDLGRLADDLPDYLAWRFRSVGGNLKAVFEPAAIPMAVERADTPQLLNNLAAAAMHEAFLDGAPRVTAEHVLKV